MGALALAGFGFYRYVKRGRVHRDWTEVLNDTAKRLNGQASLGSRFDSPQLRTSIDGISITISFKDAHRAQDKGTAIAEAQLDLATDDARLYFAWNVIEIRKELTYIPEVELPFTFGLPTPHVVRANHPKYAERFLRYIANDIVDVKREANAHGLEFLLRAGGLRMAVHGIERSPWAVERIATATARIARGVRFCLDTPDDQIPDLNSQNAPSTSKVECILCSSSISSDLLKCNRCNAEYHHTCWRQATGCIVEDCYETRATPE